MADIRKAYSTKWMWIDVIRWVEHNTNPPRVGNYDRWDAAQALVFRLLCLPPGCLGQKCTADPEQLHYALTYNIQIPVYCGPMDYVAERHYKSPPRRNPNNHTVSTTTAAVRTERLSKATEQLLENY